MGVQNNSIGAVLVVGGGIGGIQASLDLANSGIKVYLLDNSSTIGGVMAQLDKTFPTNDCSMCIMAPKLVECGRHLNIEKITNARVKNLAGEAGNFQVTVVERSRYVDISKCTGCGVCARSCPVGARDAYNEELGERAGIYINYPQAVPRAYIIDKNKCIGCGLCENLCLAKAVKYTDSDKEMTLSVGSIILAPGFDEFKPAIKSEYGYKRFPNVVTSIEFERILSASGPYKGHVLRPSDGDIPKKLAFIQCVGSRDSKCENEYCSSVCCMYSIKEAVIAKEHQRDVEPAIFFMDMRAYGKDFDKYYERARNESVRFVRSRVSSIAEDISNGGNLLVKYETEDGKVITEAFDMAVLAVGFEPPKDVERLAADLGIELNEYGFCKSNDLYPVATTKPGVFVCGAFAGPKDIPETVTQASAAACKAGDLLAHARGTLVAEKKYPDEINVEGERPRVGVFVCHCGINIGGYVDVPSVMEYAQSLPYVVYAERNLYTCSQDTQEKIKETIKEHNLNRIVVASCSPRTHEPLFQETIREAGLNRYLFEMANIRDQCSWVHMFEPEKATEKAKDLVRMAVAKAARLTPLQRFPLNVTKGALVIGGGLAGMVASLSLAAQGIEVHLVEREEELGGNLRHIYSTLDGKDIQAHLRGLMDNINQNELIHVYKGSEIKDISGYVGNFETTIIRRETRDMRHETRDTRVSSLKSQVPSLKSEVSSLESQVPSLESQVSSLESVKHGVIIVATGGKEYQPTEYLYGQDLRIVTQSQLEQLIFENQKSKIKNQKFQTVVMIQCVGSRDESRPYCSRYCCSQAVKNALKIKKMNPDANVFILYRDMRTYGFREVYYKQAREAGVIFIRYDLLNKPNVYVEGGKLYVSVTDPIIGEKLLLEPDLLALSVAAVPNADSQTLAQMLRVPLNADGFFLEAHVKLRPVDFATEGIFVCGLCHSPKSIEETIDQACAAVSRATTILSSDVIEAEGLISQVDITRCTACGMCELLCPYKAIEVKVVDQRRGTKAAQINEALCKGCGVCAANCRCEAIDVRGFTDEQIFVAINALTVVTV